MPNNIRAASLPTRYTLVGIVALAMINLIDWARAQQLYDSETFLYLLGVLPNFAAAIAIPLVLLGIWSGSNPTTLLSQIHRRFVLATMFAGLGLTAWEFLQASSHSLVFDPHDLAATLVGSIFSTLLFTLTTPRSCTKTSKTTCNRWGTL